MQIQIFFLFIQICQSISRFVPIIQNMVLHKNKATYDLLFNLFIADIGRTEAEQILNILKYKQLFPLPAAETEVSLIAFLSGFWDWDSSIYIKERLLQKNGIHRRYVARCAASVRNYWLPWFGDTLPLSGVSRMTLKEFVLSFMKRKVPKSAKGKNDIIRSGTIALRWAFQNGLMSEDVTAGLSYYSGDTPEIAILPSDIVRALFNRQWKHKKAMFANKLAMLSGLRAGEIQALRGCDIGTECVYVRHSWNLLDGLKKPKNGSERIVYVPFPAFLDELRSFATEDCDFIFHIRSAHQPMDAKCWLRELRAELHRLSVDELLIRKINFHSWRHYFITHMKNEGKLESRLLQRVSGHKTATMLEHYADHSLENDVEIIKKTAVNIFAPFLDTNIS